MFCLENKSVCCDYWDSLTNFLTPLFDAIQNSSYSLLSLLRFFDIINDDPFLNVVKDSIFCLQFYWSNHEGQLLLDISKILYPFLDKGWVKVIEYLLSMRGWDDNKSYLEFMIKFIIKQVFVLCNSQFYSLKFSHLWRSCQILQDEKNSLEFLWCRYNSILLTVLNYLYSG